MADPKKASPKKEATAVPFVDVDLVELVLGERESTMFEVKRAGDNEKKVKTAVAFANTEGGTLVIGVEDEEKASGHDRLWGIEENEASIDEFHRCLKSRITPPIQDPNEPQFGTIACKLRDGKDGRIAYFIVPKSANVHSVVDGGTYTRLGKSNRQISAAEITELAMQRGTASAVSVCVEVDLELLQTDTWRDYARQRKLTRPINEALAHLGLARQDGKGVLRPTRAAVLLFAEDPSGLLDSKCAIRIFHYRGDSIEHSPTNLAKPPTTIGGPLIGQIRDAFQAVLGELGSGVQRSPLGFELVQKYPIRVIQEAITNAVIHRDYRLSVDIQVRIFANRIEIESPGLLPGPVTTSNLGKIGSRPRNRALVDNLREFSAPPNLDAGEGVRMMRETMDKAALFPPVYLTTPETPRECVIVRLLNEARPTVWAQVESFLESHPNIGNREVRAILKSDDALRASKLLREWVTLGLLVVTDPNAAKQNRRYRRPGKSVASGLFSKAPGNQDKKST